MQIFSPYSSFVDIANCLDNRRLQKQKVEIVQILQTIKLGNNAKGWKNHPAISMVRGFELFFIEYGLEIANACVAKGWKDTRIPILKELKTHFKGDCVVPWYWCKEEFHASHKSNLIRKKPEHYKKFWPNEVDCLPYWWPTKHLDKKIEEV